MSVAYNWIIIGEKKSIELPLDENSVFRANHVTHDLCVLDNLFEIPLTLTNTHKLTLTLTHSHSNTHLLKLYRSRFNSSGKLINSW